MTRIEVPACDVLTTDGAVAHIERLTEGDGPRMIDFYRSLSPEDVHSRFFSVRLPTDEVLTRPLSPARPNDVALGVEIGGELVAVGMYTVPTGVADPVPEVAFVVDSAHRHRGLATVLLEHLAAWARSAGYDRIGAITRPSNRDMLAVFRHVGLQLVTDYDSDGVHFVFDLSAPPPDTFDERAQTSAARSLHRLLSPETVAVVTDGPPDVAPDMFDRLAEGAAVAVVATDVARADEPLTLPHASLVIADVATPALEPVIRAAAEAGAAGVLSLSTASPAASAVVARDAGVRLIGPDSAGVLNTDPDIQLAATRRPVEPVAGGLSIGCDTDSDLDLLDAITHAGIGIATFVSLGARFDVSPNDLLEFWVEHEATRVVALELTSVGNPRRFARAIRRLGTKKPIVLLLHEPPDDVTIADAFAEAGVVAVDHRGELIAQARALLATGRERRPPSIATAPGDTRSEVIDEVLRTGVEEPERGGRLTSTATRELLRGAGVELHPPSGPPDPRRTTTLRAWCHDVFGPMLCLTPPGGGRDRHAPAPLSDQGREALTVDLPAPDRAQIDDAAVRLAHLVADDPRIDAVVVRLQVEPDGTVTVFDAEARTAARSRMMMRMLEPVTIAP